MNFFKLGLAILCLSVFSGCAAVAVTGGSLGVGYAVTNVARKTVNHPLDKVIWAVMDASEKMEIKVVKNHGDKEERYIEAATKKLNISIQLESITPKTTKMTINTARRAFPERQADRQRHHSQNGEYSRNRTRYENRGLYLIKKF